MAAPYVVFGHHSGTTWRPLSAWATEALALEELENLKLKGMSAHEKRVAATSTTGWRFWEKQSNRKSTDGLPIKWLHVWQSNSTGPRNPWSRLCVATFIVQGTILDKIAEAV